MLRLSETQISQLNHLEKMQYVAEVRKTIIAEHRELANDGTLKNRLEQAYTYATAIGFMDGPAITQFLYYEAFAPRFYRQPAINVWLTKPGHSVEQRFSDLIAQMKSKLRAY